MKLLISLLLLVASVSSFSVGPLATSRHASARSMVATDPDGTAKANPLETVQSSADADALSSLSTTQIPRNIVKDMNTGEIKEVKWVDPAMYANTNPWEMNWWAYPLTLFPLVLLADDVFHFMPHK